MRRWLVGGAVRDGLLGVPCGDRDWLVTESTPEELLRLGYHRVGSSFPVFLDPVAREEHAFPRQPGHTGRDAIEQDLLHRDLTINALARGPDGQLIDPCGGQGDIERRLLRHTPGFHEDPLRVLRLARLAARYAGLGFRIADETLALVQRMAADGQLDSLVPERSWSEIARALAGPEPVRFIRALRELGALARLLPELDRLFGVPQPPQHHPEVDSGEHSLLVLAQACRLSGDPRVRFAALLHDLGKGLTPPEQWPRHHGHEASGARLVDGVCRRLRVPNDWHRLAHITAALHLHVHRAPELRPKTLLKLISHTDALRRGEQFEQFLLACEADARGRAGFEETPYPQADYLRGLREALVRIDIPALLRETHPGIPPQVAIQRARLRALAERRPGRQER